MILQRPSMIGIGHLTPDPCWRIRNHSHAFHEMIVVMEGILHVEISGRETAAGRGSALLYPAGMPHREWSDSKNPFETYFISFQLTAPALSEFCVKNDMYHRIRQLATWLYANRVSKRQQSQQQNHLLLQLILHEFLAPEQNVDHDLVALTRNIIINHISQPLQLDEIAREVGLSKYHFIRKFKRLAGHTPMAEKRVLQMDYARDMLLTTDLSLKEIAVKAGINDEYTFSHLFRTHFGMPPGIFRKNRKPWGVKVYGGKE